MMSESKIDIWDDLTGMKGEKILEMKKEKKALLNSLQIRLNELRSERKEQVQIVKSLRSVVGGVEASDSGRKKLLSQFHNHRKKSQKHREFRDTINKRIPPPSSILQEWLKETYEGLTKVANDLTAVQMLNPELSAFSRFFEIQASIKIKREAETSHEKYVSCLGEMRKISSKLDKNKDIAKKTVSELKENIEIEEDKISRKEIRKVSKGISSIDGEIDRTNIEIKVIRKEVKRIEKYSRVSMGRSGAIGVGEIRSIAAKGGSLSTEEMDLILVSGGLKTIPDEVKEENASNLRSRKSKKKGRKLGVSRKGSRRGSIAGRRE
ncbi:MAG: hypothetical protein CMB61_01625 [Euryarchaeota archaeon]|nr:hypothetical protein [Euryarchaeota archaeon]